MEVLANQYDYFWRDYTGSIPDDAIESDGLYIAQILHQGLLPATLYPDKKEAFTVCSGKVIVNTRDIKVLCDKSKQNFYWEWVNVNELNQQELQHCVKGGEEADSTLYIGKTFHEGEWKIGKVFPPTSRWKGLGLWCKDGHTFEIHDFKILKYRSTS